VVLATQKSKQNTTYILNTKEKQKKTVLANRTIYTLIWYAFTISSQETLWALFLALQPRSPQLDDILPDITYLFSVLC